MRPKWGCITWTRSTLAWMRSPKSSLRFTDIQHLPVQGSVPQGFRSWTSRVTFLICKGEPVILWIWHLWGSSGDLRNNFWNDRRTVSGNMRFSINEFYAAHGWQLVFSINTKSASMNFIRVNKNGIRDQWGTGEPDCTSAWRARSWIVNLNRLQQVFD